MKHLYTKKHLAFLRTGYKTMMTRELTQAFNKKFDANRTEMAIRSALRNNKILSGRTGAIKGMRLSLNDEQILFLRNRYPLIGVDDLTAELNEKYGLQKTVSFIKTFVHNHGINSGRTGRIEKGNIPWNTGTKGLVKPNSGNFKKGSIPPNAKPLWHERICPKDGYILMKVPEKNPYTKAPTRYLAKHIYIWEQANGKIPAGMIVTFIDGNKLNCVIENLETITKAMNLYLNRHHYTDLPDDLKPSMKALAKLETKRFSLQKTTNGD